MKSYTLDIKVGDKVEVGRFRNVMTTVTSNRDRRTRTTSYNYKQRSKKLLSPRLKKLSGAKTPKQILLERNKTKILIFPLRLYSIYSTWKKQK